MYRNLDKVIVSDFLIYENFVVTNKKGEFSLLVLKKRHLKVDLFLAKFVKQNEKATFEGYKEAKNKIRGWFLVKCQNISIFFFSKLWIWILDNQGNKKKNLFIFY